MWVAYITYMIVFLERFTLSYFELCTSSERRMSYLFHFQIFTEKLLS